MENPNLLEIAKEAVLPFLAHLCEEEVEALIDHIKSNGTVKTDGSGDPLPPDPTHPHP